MGLVFTGLIAGTASRFGRMVGLVNALAAFLLWNFFFLPPVYTFSVADPRDVVALGVFLLVGLVTGTLAGKVRGDAEAATARIEALRRISLFGQRFSRAATLSDLLRDTAEEAAAMTTAGMVMISGKKGLEVGAAVPVGTVLDEAAQAAAEWSFRNDTETGIGTGTLPSVPWRFLPLRANGKAIGVLGALPKSVPPAPLGQTLSALANQAAMALERCSSPCRRRKPSPRKTTRSSAPLCSPRSATTCGRRSPAFAARPNAHQRRQRAGRGNPRRPARQHHPGYRADDQIPHQHHGNGAGRYR